MWVYPGSGVAPSRCDRRSSAATTACAPASSSSMASRRYSRSAVSTWSLRDRPRWMRPPAGPMRAVSRRSSAVWPSSSLSSTCHSPRCVLLAERREPIADQLQIPGRQQPLRVQHVGMRDRGAHVVAHQALIERMVFPGGVLQHPRIERRALVPQPCHAAAASCGALLLGRRQRVDVGHDQGAGAFVGEDLSEDAVGARRRRSRARGARRRESHLSIALAFGSMPSTMRPSVAQALQSRQVGIGNDRRSDRRRARGCRERRCKESASRQRAPRRSPRRRYRR